MFCNYQNIADYCCNKYSYRYATVIAGKNGPQSLSNSDSPVIRIDNSTLEETRIDSFSSEIIYNCGSSDSEDFIGAWNCYQIYRNVCDGNIDDAKLTDYVDYQANDISNLYYDTLSNGYLVAIDDFIVSSIIGAGSGSGSGSGSENVTDETKSFSIRLKAREEDKVYYGNVFALANSIYISNSDEELPYIIDFYNKAHKFSYQNMVKIFNSYFNGLKRLQTVRDDAINRINSSDTIDKISDTNVYQSKPSEKLAKESSFVQEVLTIDRLSCSEKKNIDTPVFCDDSSDCDEGQTCNEGICS